MSPDLERDVRNAIVTGNVPPHLWLDVIQFQVTNNPVYQTHTNGIYPESLDTIKPIPISAFKYFDLSIPGEPEGWFQSSGTTRGTDTRSIHHVHRLTLYDLSIQYGFNRSELATLTPLQVVILSPSPHEAPHSSLAYMMNHLAQHHFQSVPIYWGLQPNGDIDITGIQQRLEDHPGGLVLGITSAIRLLAESLTLKSGILVGLMDTGGTKGQINPLPRNELIQLYETQFGLSPNQIYNEYGMCELLSQSYTSADDPYWLIPPPWLHVSIRDTHTLDPLPAGETGLLQFIDLANLYSVSPILTEDIGKIRDDGCFQVLGRVQGAEARGCSLLLEELLNS